MGISIASIEIQWSARCASECLRQDVLNTALCRGRLCLPRGSFAAPYVVSVETENRAVHFFSNYYVRVVYKVVNDEFPPELSDLFIDDGACLKGVYVKCYEPNQPK